MDALADRCTKFTDVIVLIKAFINVDVYILKGCKATRGVTNDLLELYVVRVHVHVRSAAGRTLLMPYANI